MKVCANCYTENPLDEVFCSNCGMSLRAAPTGDEAAKLLEEAKELLEAARKVEEERQRRLERPLTASGMVYLFGHQFARPWVRSAMLRAAAKNGGKVGLSGWLGLLVAPYWWAPAQVPLSGQEVWSGDLGLKLWEVALISLAQDGYIHLQVERRRSSLFPAHEVAIRQVKPADDLPSSLERSIREGLTTSPEMRWLRDVVIRHTKQLGNWGAVVNIARDALVEMGWLQRGVVDKEFVHEIPTEKAATRLDAMAGEVETVVARVMTFAAENPELHGRLLHDVRDGVYVRSGRPWWQR